MQRLWIACSIVLCLTACYDSGFDSPAANQEPPLASLSLQELCANHTGDPVTIINQIQVTGIVTSSDRSQNFYRSFCIGEPGAGVEVMAGVDHLHNDYPIGCRVSIRLRGLTIGRRYGVLQIGRAAQPGSGYPTDFLGSPAAIRGVISRTTETLTPLEPLLCTLPELSPVLCGTLVRIDNLRYSPEGIAEATWAGYKRFTDDHDREIYTYVRSYAAFAQRDVPAGTLSLIGILQYDAGRYSLKLRDENDCVQ